MKVYTKKGDQGETSLIGGTRVPKHHLRIDSYGTVDELNSWIGVLRDQETPAELKSVLIIIQDRLFTIGSWLASDPGKAKMKLPEITDADVTYLESEMDRMDASLPPLRSFVLPGGHQAVSFAHVARCVCRRAERLVSALSEVSEVAPLVLQYLNRLSDYLFVVSRWLSHELKAEETPWNPKA